MEMFYNGQNDPDARNVDFREISTEVMKLNSIITVFSRCSCICLGLEISRIENFHNIFIGVKF